MFAISYNLSFKNQTMKRIKSFFWTAIVFYLISGQTSWAEETLSITTYYPIPYGVYTRMTLYPDNFDLTLDCKQEGELRYHRREKKLYVCSDDGTSYKKWKLAGSSSGAELWSKVVDKIYDGNESCDAVGDPDCDIYYDKGNVGIALHLEDNSNDFTFQGGGNSGYLEVGDDVYIEDVDLRISQGGFWQKKGPNNIESYISNVVFGSPQSRDQDVVIKGLGNSAATNSLEIINSAGNVLFLARDDGNVGIGTANPQARLEVQGSLRISHETAIPGRVLTSDKNGIARWQTPLGGENGAGGLFGWCMEKTGPKSCTKKDPAKCNVNVCECELPLSPVPLKLGKAGNKTYFSCYQP